MTALAVNLGAQHIDDLSVAPISFSASGDSNIIAAGTTPLRILALILSAAGATSVALKAGASTTLVGPIPLTTGLPLILNFTTKSWAVVPAGSAFIINSSNAVACGGAAY